MMLIVDELIIDIPGDVFGGDFGVGADEAGHFVATSAASLGAESLARRQVPGQKPHALQKGVRE